MDSEILAQLVQIKWLLVAFVVVLILRVCFRTWSEVRASGGLDAMFSDRNEFAERARTFLEQGRHSEALELAQNRIKRFPGDALAFWYHATAAHRLGNLAEALASLRKAQDLQPDWSASHVRPFIEAIESQGLVAVPKVELNVITPSVLNSQDVPPTPSK